MSWLRNFFIRLFNPTLWKIIIFQSAVGRIIRNNPGTFVRLASYAVKARQLLQEPRLWSRAEIVDTVLERVDPLDQPVALLIVDSLLEGWEGDTSLLTLKDVEWLDTIINKVNDLRVYVPKEER